MGGPTSVVFSDIYVCKMEEDIVISGINYACMTLMYKEKV